MNKDELRVKFQQEWEKHYKIDTLSERGFKRYKCKKCGRHFWSVVERDYCQDPGCVGYEFIGDAPSQKKLDYIETWKIIEKYFTSHGHESIKPFPTVARWRDDLYFTIASINDFQPYVVNGELEPIANPLIVPQPCIRFTDIDNVGKTGRHYTNFVMIGQHAFNTEKTGLFYWKNEAIEHDINYLKELGIKEEDIVFIEDVWMGGGNFGPSMEYFSKGLELGNVVFMQFEIFDSSYRELKTKVIDMGAGLSRLCWITHGTPTSYELVMKDAVAYLKKENSIAIDEKLFVEYAKEAGKLNVDEPGYLEAYEKMKERFPREFLSQLERLQALYAIADHFLTTLFTTIDGMMPSNSGGGYNIRLILRRAFSLQELYGIEFETEKLLEKHGSYLYPLFPHLKDGVYVVSQIIEEERKKWKESKERAKKKLVNLFRKKEKLEKEELKLLYQSDGITPEMIKEVAKELGKEIEISPDIYLYIKEQEEIKKKKEEKIKLSREYPATVPLYYTMNVECDAEIIGIEKDWIILDRTVFYPEGGGQSYDTGYINDVPVVEVQKVRNVILHRVSHPEKLKVGEKVKAKINVERRKQLSYNHTGTHLILAAARKILGKHVWQAGSFKEEKIAHVDLTHYKRITEEELEKMEQLVNTWIFEGHDIVIEELPRNVAEQKYGFIIYQGGAIPGKTLRIVKIEGIDVEACGGTHHFTGNTKNLGFLKIIKRESVQDGVERIVYTTNKHALLYVERQEKLLRNAAKVLSTSPEHLEKSIARIFAEWKERKKKIEKLAEKYADLIFDTLPENLPMRIRRYESEIANKLIDKVAKSESKIFIGVDENNKLYIAVGKNSKVSAQELLEKLKERFEVKAGGRGNVIFGKIENFEEIEIK